MQGPGLHLGKVQGFTWAQILTGRWVSEPAVAGVVACKVQGFTWAQILAGRWVSEPAVAGVVAWAQILAGRWVSEPAVAGLDRVGVCFGVSASGGP